MKNKTKQKIKYGCLAALTNSPQVDKMVKTTYNQYDAIRILKNQIKTFREYIKCKRCKN